MLFDETSEGDPSHSFMALIFLTPKGRVFENLTWDIGVATNNYVESLASLKRNNYIKTYKRTPQKI